MGANSLSSVFGQLHHRMEAPVRILEPQQRVVEHRVKAAAQHGEYAQLIVRPLDGAQRGAQRPHFLAPVEAIFEPTSRCAMPRASRQRTYSCVRSVPKLVKRRNRMQTCSGRTPTHVPVDAVAHLPAALIAEPLDEGRHRVRRAGVDLHIGNIARAVGMRHGQRDDAGWPAGPSTPPSSGR